MYRTLNKLLCRSLLLGLSLIASSVWGYANGAALGVVYPDARAPYNKVFESIIRGIESETGQSVDRYLLGESFNTQGLESKIAANGNQVILALGMRGVKAVRGTGLSVPVVVGAIMPRSDDQQMKVAAGISLMPDPAELFRKLQNFAPSIRTVSVVYNPANNQALIDYARVVAESLGLKLDAHAARDLRSAALVYRELAETIDPQKNAIWLLQDRSTMDSETILPSLLEEAWVRHLIVFSSKLKHARRGALFSMYPDNFKMGQELGKLAESAKSASKAGDIGVLRSLKTAVNTHTAKHLGIDLLARGQKSFDLVFPIQ